MNNNLKIAEFTFDDLLSVDWIEGSEFGTMELYFDEEGDLIISSTFSESNITFKPNKDFFLRVMSQIYDKSANMNVRT